MTFFDQYSIIPDVNAMKNASNLPGIFQRAFGWCEKAGKADEYGSERQAESRRQVGCDGLHPIQCMTAKAVVEVFTVK